MCEIPQYQDLALLAWLCPGGLPL